MKSSSLSAPSADRALLAALADHLIAIGFTEDGLRAAGGSAPSTDPWSFASGDVAADGSPLSVIIKLFAHGIAVDAQLAGTAFGSISEASRRAQVPIFAFQKSQAIGGAMVVVARDYRDSGRHAAHLAARIIRGENPKHIPLQDFGNTNLVVNLDAARALNITLPPALVRSAKEVIGAADGNR